MNTEPPVGDELQRMLVSMKQHVLERAESRPRRRRLTGIAIGVVSVLLLGAAGGGVALGLIPTSLTAEPTPTATSTPEQTASETPSGAPVIGRPTPRSTPTSTPTSTRAPYSVADPSTWTISGNEVGPIALGAPIAGELDDLGSAYTREVEYACPAPEVTNWDRPDSPGMTVIEGDDGTVSAVAIGSGPAGDDPGPTTAEGFGTGSTVEELRAAYPDLTFVPSSYGPEPDGPSAQWTIERNGYHVTFVTGEDGRTVGIVWVSSVAQAPPEFCG